MRIIRFLDPEGRVQHGEQLDDESAAILLDPQGVLGPVSPDQWRRRFDGMRAMVADDDENMRELMATVLRRVGCECTVCRDGAEAVALIEREPIDLVISDIAMPHHNGYEIFTVARERRPDLPVVLVTGYGYDPSHSLVRASKEGLAAVLYKPFSPNDLLEELDRAIRITAGWPAGTLQRQDGSVPIQKLLAPLVPTDVICIGRNYREPGSLRSNESLEHLEVFMKPSTAIQAHEGPIRIPDCGGDDPRVDVEGELAIVIGAPARDLPESEALDCVLGFTVANDVTARHWQLPAGAPIWMRGKGFDTFCPLGPAIVTPDEVDDPNDLGIRTVLNGVTIRQGSTADMIRSVESIISGLSRYLTLEPGAVVLTGAPPRMNTGELPPRSLRPGDEVAVEIDGIGRLVNHVETR